MNYRYAYSAKIVRPQAITRVKERDIVFDTLQYHPALETLIETELKPLAKHCILEASDSLEHNEVALLLRGERVKTFKL